MTADQPDMPSSCGLRIDLAGEVDLKRAIDRDEATEIAEHQRIVRVGCRADMDRRVVVGKPVDPLRPIRIVATVTPVLISL